MGFGKYFEDSRQRIERAHEHFVNFANLWNEVLEDEPYTTYVSVDPDGRGRIEVEPSPRIKNPAFSLELGEGIYQLRAALDGAVRACAIIDSGQDPPPDEEKLEFPITPSAAKFKAAAWKIRPLDDYRRWMIETIQPYNIVKDLAPHLLVLSPHRAMDLINSWGRIDRHRRLHVVGSWGGNRDPLLILPDGVSLAWMLVTYDGFLEDEYEVASFTLEGWQDGMHLKANPNLTIDISLREEPVPAADNDTLSERCQWMRIFVAEMVKGFEESFATHPPAHLAKSV